MNPIKQIYIPHINIQFNICNIYYLNRNASSAWEKSAYVQKYRLILLFDQPKTQT